MATEDSCCLNKTCFKLDTDCTLLEENVTIEPTAEVPITLDTGLLVLAAVVLVVIIVLSALGNIMVLFVIFKHLRFKTVTNTFIMTMSLSDLGSTFVCMPMSVITVVRQEWVFSGAGCVVHSLLTSALSLLSTFMLMYITIDRYFVVVKLPQQPLAVRSAILAIAAACTLALLTSAPWYLITVPGDGSWAAYKHGYYHCMYYFHLNSSHYPGPAFSAVYITVCYVLPICCMLYSSACLWSIIHHNDSRIRPASTPVSQLRFNGEMRTAKTVVVMVMLYIITRVPYIVVGIICAFVGSDVPVALDTVVMWLFWSNCAVNPVIYAFRNPTVAQLLRIGRKSGYTMESPPDLPVPSIVTPSDITGEILTPRQCKYLPSTSVGTPGDGDPELQCTCEGKDHRSDSIPSVLLFRAYSSCSGPRKGSGFSTITTSTNTTTM